MSGGVEDMARDEREARLRAVVGPDVFGAAQSEEARGRAALAHAVATDETLTRLGDYAYGVARTFAGAYGGPLGATGADVLRLVVEQAVRRNAAGGALGALGAKA